MTSRKKKPCTGLQRRGGLVTKFFETMQADRIMTMHVWQGKNFMERQCFVITLLILNH